MANPSLTVPDGQWYRVISMYAQLTTNSVSSTRQVACEILDPASNVVVVTAPPITQEANHIGYYWFAPGIVAAGSNPSGNVFAQAPFPDILLRQGYQVEVTVLYTQTGDMWGSVYAMVEVYTQNTPSTATVEPVAVPLLA